MKKLLSIVIALCLVLAMSLTAFASKEGRRYTQGDVTYVDTASIDLNDLQRLEDAVNWNLWICPSRWLKSGTVRSWAAPALRVYPFRLR